MVKRTHKESHKLKEFINSLGPDESSKSRMSVWGLVKDLDEDQMATLKLLLKDAFETGRRSRNREN